MTFSPETWKEKAARQLQKLGDWLERRKAQDAPYRTPFDLPNHPVVGVSWYEAVAFCRWLTETWRAEGKIADDEIVRLPTEAEWEHEIIVQTAQDIAVLIEHLGKDRRADTSRVGMTGLSMGGFTTFYVAANDPQVQVAVPMIGIPAFAARWEDVVLETSAYAKWAGAMEAVQDETARRTAFMREIDPFDKMRAFCPKPLLMLNGDKDIDSPKKYSVDLYRALKPLYVEHPAWLRLNIHDDAGHEVTPLMMQDACVWFCKHLQ